MNSATIVRFLREHIPDLVAIYQFGSQVRGDATPDSDIDLAILAKRTLPSERLFELGQELAARLGRDVDLLDLKRASTVMRAQVLATGRILDSREGSARAEFEMYAYSDYARLNEERRQPVRQSNQAGCDRAQSAACLRDRH
ncbi:MAG: nucleotidyltransferase domain-containing protein [Nitrospira sp.]|nr:nucleotidyltransferase domain-containing protein [Nitrospira sp.]MEB2337459.1 nucleotidyltransferase domain-containing protein [Nitrospirales bacterium]QOJ35405.1 MAG: nucleotidyltransferase domain-containing protein [Nitrospira sp.]